MRAFSIDKDLSSSFVISWNHQEFEVQYNSLADEIKIGKCVNVRHGSMFMHVLIFGWYLVGEYYLRLLLEEEEKEETEDTNAIKKS